VVNARCLPFDQFNDKYALIEVLSTSKYADISILEYALVLRELWTETLNSLYKFHTNKKTGSQSGGYRFSVDNSESLENARYKWIVEAQEAAEL